MKRHMRLIVALMALSLAVSATAGCAGGKAESTGSAKKSTAEFPVTLTDDADREVTIEAAPERIVSLAPGNTEIIGSLGLLEKLVGVTTLDDYPPAVADIEKVGDFAGPNLEKVAAADPDLVVMTAGVQADVIAKLEEMGAIVLVVDPTDLDGLYADIELLGKATGATAEATKVIEDMKADESEITDKLAGTDSTPCFIEIAQNPIYTAGPGTLMSDLIVRAGGRNIVTEKGYVAYSAEQIVAADPAVYFVTKGSMSSPEGIAARAGFDKLSAVKESRVVVLDDNLVSRPGPRAIEGMLSMARALHPDEIGE